jgi:hypothetical protein
MIEFVDKTPEVSGTPINRKNMMGIQGFVGKTTRFMNDGSIQETNEYGEIKTTTFDSSGTITEKFQGQKIITKKTYFQADGSIREVIT